MKIKEIKIPVPWGHIAAKLWGDESDEAIIMVHGILDNVGTFDRLIPLLQKNYYYICIELPGHGQSSHWPEFSVINSLDYLLVYRATAEYFKRDKYILLGHSWGGQLAFIFTQVYPEYVSKLIMLDIIYLFPKSTLSLKFQLRYLHDSYFEMMKKLESNQTPEYTYEEALVRMTKNRRYNELTVEAAEPLLERMSVPTENGKLKFSTDQRLKIRFDPPMDFRYISDFIKKEPVSCPVLIILASDTEIQQVYFKRILRQYQSYKNIRVKVVEGNHDVHNVWPKRVAPLICKFLEYKQSKL